MGKFEFAKIAQHKCEVKPFQGVQLSQSEKSGQLDCVLEGVSYMHPE